MFFAIKVIKITVVGTSAVRSNVVNRVSAQSWGQVNGEEVKKFTLRNTRNQEVDIISYGATITSIRTPDKAEKIDDVVLGFDNIEGYLSKLNPYFGATVGRFANRMKKGQFELDGVQYQISLNNGNNSLHGGVHGWNSKIWETAIENNDTVVMTLLSKNGDEGFPGDVLASISFKLADDGRLIIEMKSTSTKATPINLTNHSYFNLAGHGSNATEIYKHKIIMSADRWTVVDSEFIPTGEIRRVRNSTMDLRKLTVLRNVINKVPGDGYDYNFCLPPPIFQNRQKFVAKVVHPTSGRSLEVFSNQPGVQFYTANSLPEVGSEGIVGKEGKQYFKHGAFCLETQNYPDAINHANFPNSILRPSELYYHIVTYKFGVSRL